MEGDLRDNSRTITRKGKTKKLIEVWGGKTLPQILSVVLLDNVGVHG